jgi:hypothetical protein
MRLPDFSVSTIQQHPSYLALTQGIANGGGYLVQPASGPPARAPRPGCYFAGTSCYGAIQTCKFCCGDGTEYTEQCGWCVGVWMAPPCRPGR